MTELLQRAFERLNAMPAEQQDKIARYLMQVSTDGSETENIPLEYMDGILAGLAQADRGEFVPEQEMKAYFDRHLK